MSGGRHIPLTPRSGMYPVETEEATTKADECEGLIQETLNRIHVSTDQVDVYLRKFVPSNAPCTLDDDFANRDIFAGWPPPSGKETERYDTLVRAVRSHAPPV